MYGEIKKINIYLSLKILICCTLIFGLALNGALGLTSVAHAAEKIIYVNSSANGNMDGSSWKNAFTELQPALEAASEGDEIWITEGIYYPTKDMNGSASPIDVRTKSFQMKNEVKILGGFPDDNEIAKLDDRNVSENETILSGDLNKNNAIDDTDAYHVFYHPQGVFISGSAVLDGVTITGGNANNYLVVDGTSGGGMFNDRSHPKLANVTIEKNYAQSGGGIYNQNSKMHFDNGVISENSSNTGGGLFNNNGDPLLTNMIIENNTATDNGGGIYSTSSKLTISKSLIANNTAGSSGGGLYSNSEGKLDDVNILYNTARNGAGLYLSSSTFIMNDGEVAGNVAKGDGTSNGGGIFSSNSWNSSFNNVDIQDNSASSGGGIYLQSGREVYSNTTINNNHAINGGGVSIMSGNPIFRESEISNNAAGEKGGGVLNNTAQPTFSNTTINSNTAKNGAGIYSFEGKITSGNSMIKGNKASNSGGASYNYDSELLFTNNLVSGNEAVNGGGFYENNASASKFINTTVVGNTADRGGSFYNSASSPVIQNSIIWNNANAIHNSESTPVFAYSLVQDSGGSNSWNSVLGKDEGSNLDANPRFLESKASTDAPTSEGNYRLAPNSAAIDKGNNEFVLEAILQDIDGNYRKMGTAVDLGAYENIVPDTDNPKWPVNSWLNAYSHEKNSLRISWPFANDNYSIKAYKIYLDGKLIDEVVQPVSVEGNPIPYQGEYIIKGLKSNTQYSISVEAYDEAGNVSKRLNTQATTMREEDTEEPLWPIDAAVQVEEKVGYGIEVSWIEANDNQEVKEYLIGVNGGEYRSYRNTVRKANLQDLRPDTEYEIEVVAMDYAGNSSEPLKIAYKTKKIWQDETTFEVSEDKNNPPKLTVPPTKSGLVREYEVLIDGNPRYGIWFSNPIIYMNSLLPDTEYEISINAVLYNGDKIEMEKTNYKTLPIWKEDAKLTFSEIRQTSLKIEWPEVESGLANYYEILVDGEIWSNGSNNTKEYIFNLKPGTEYEFKIRLFDYDLNILKELSSKISTAPYSDEEPPYWNHNQELKATEIKETSMKLLWPKASDNEGIKGYRIFVDNEEIANVDSSKTEYVIDGLIKGTTYTLMVQAYDEKENAAFIRLGVQTASSSGGGNNGGGQVIVLPPAPSVPQVPVTPPVIEPPASQPETPEAPEEPTKPNTQLADIKGHWAEKQIIEGVEKNMINGYLDNTFRPDNQINRAEFTILLANALGLTGDGENLNFTDNSKIGPSARAAIKRALKAGLVHGFEDGTFRPMQKITRMEMAAMIARAMKLEGDAKANTGFSDDGSIPAWARGAIAAMKETGVISGRGNNKFEPTVNATRAETVVMLLRMMKYEK